MSISFWWELGPILAALSASFLGAARCKRILFGQLDLQHSLSSFAAFVLFISHHLEQLTVCHFLQRAVIGLLVIGIYSYWLFDCFESIFHHFHASVTCKACDSWYVVLVFWLLACGHGLLWDLPWVTKCSWSCSELVVKACQVHLALALVERNPKLILADCFVSLYSSWILSTKSTQYIVTKSTRLDGRSQRWQHLSWSLGRLELW